MSLYAWGIDSSQLGSIAQYGYSKFKKVLHFTSADLGFSGEIFGEDCGVLVVVCGGVPGSDADFSVSFCMQAIGRPYFLHSITHIRDKTLLQDSL